jgi:hypothetical protein
MAVDRDLMWVTCSECDLWLYWEPLAEEHEDDPFASILSASWRAVTIDESRSKCRHAPQYERQP